MVKVSCTLCGVFCSTYASLCAHVFGQKHRKVVQRVSPDTVEELGRLQYFLDKYMATVPLLGLEYVVEVQAGSSYRYTCMLCNMHLHWLRMVTHITDMKHTETYINRHHSDLLGSNYRMQYRDEQMRELNTLAETILTKYGRKRIRVKDSAADIPKLPTMAGPSHKEQPVMAGPSQKEQPAMAGPSHEEQPAMAGPSQKEQPAMAGPSHEELPAMACPSHEELLAMACPSHKELPAIAVPSHKELPAVAVPSHKELPAVAVPSHKELPAMAGPSHKELPAMAGPSHKESGKKNGTFSGPPQDASKGSHTGMLQEGWKGDRTSADCVHYCSLCGVSSPSFLALSQHVMSAQHRQHVQAIQRSRKPRKPRKSQVYRCPLCAINCNSLVMLSDHVVGSKHRENTMISTPIGEWEVGRLGHFMDTYIPEEPILGLEYIVETKLDSSYEYSCKLCKVNGKLQNIVGHLVDFYHLQLFIKKHYCSMLPFVRKGRKKAFHIRLLKRLAENILDRKENGTPMEGEDKRREDPASERGDVPPPRHDCGSSSHSKRRPLYPEENHDRYDYNMTPTKPDVEGPPLTKKLRLLPEEDLEALPSRPHAYQNPDYDESHAMELQVTSVVQELEFNDNQQFFDYLANFKIKDYHDVILIRKITQNCIRAFEKFQEEEAQRLTPGHEPEDPFVYTSSIDQKILDTSVNPESPALAPESPALAPESPALAPESPALAPETVSPKDAFNPPSELIPKNNAIDFFFSSIKNMDESEVVGIFQNIATTNPEFQDMNIPAVIRYLKNSGRLNTP